MGLQGLHQSSCMPVSSRGVSWIFACHFQNCQILDELWFVWVGQASFKQYGQTVDSVWNPKLEKFPPWHTKNSLWLFHSVPSLAGFTCLIPWSWTAGWKQTVPASQRNTWSRENFGSLVIWLVQPYKTTLKENKTYLKAYKEAIKAQAVDKWHRIRAQLLHRTQQLACEAGQPRSEDFGRVGLPYVAIMDTSRLGVKNVFQGYISSGSVLGRNIHLIP